jgi:hypothetical protein
MFKTMVLNCQSIFFCSYGRVDELVFFAGLKKQYEFVVHHYIQVGVIIWGILSFPEGVVLLFLNVLDKLSASRRTTIDNQFSQHASMSHHLMPCHLSSLKNISKNSRSMIHHLIPHHLSQLKINSKNLRKSPYVTSPFSIEKKSENSSSMSYHLMSCHISLLKNNSKNLRKSPHATSHFSFEK